MVDALAVPPTSATAASSAVPSVAARPATTLDGLMSDKVRTLRIARGWRQLDLAVAAGWSRATVVAVEGGVKRLTVRDAAVLCRVLQVPLAVLVEGAEETAALGLTS